MFESMGPGKMAAAFRKYIYYRKEMVCELCGTKDNLQIAHIKPSSMYPVGTLNYWNVRVLCRNCHDLTEKHPYIGHGKMAKMSWLCIQSKNYNVGKNK